MKNTLDIDGDLASVQSSKSNVQGLKMYANAFTYTSAGAVSSLRLGNGKFENTTFNSRLQPIQIGLGSSATSQNLSKLNFDYGGNDNNGNVKCQIITTPTVGNVAGFMATQNYTYDPLNRLKSAVETIPNQTGWKQTFKFDRYGNRTFDTTNGNTTTLANGCPTNICNPTANPNDNKLVGTTYDSVGNTSQDANGQTFTYDAENKQIQVNNASGIVGQYWYNGDGQRVKKYVPSTQETTIFVYDASNKLVAEYSTITANQADAKVSYLTNDHLGSPRITTDANGKVISQRDFLPFGEEIPRANYGSDSVRQKFTGYERDNETNLDFAQARMYNKNHGRFTSPDNFTNDIHITDPQSWNLYIYVRNNPLNLVDPSGEIIRISFMETVRETDSDGNTTERQVSMSVQFRNGMLYNEDGSEYSGNNQYALNARDYLNTLSQNTELGAMINQMVKSKREHTIMRDPNRPGRNETVPNSKNKKSGTTVFWSGEDHVINERSDSSDNQTSSTASAIVVLAHELLGHAWFIDQGKSSTIKHLFNGSGTESCISGPANCSGRMIGQSEIDAIGVENIARNHLGVKQRQFWGWIDISENLIDNQILPKKRPKLK